MGEEPALLLIRFTFAIDNTGEPMNHLPTCKITVPPCAGNEEGVVIINQSEFHEERHELVEAPKKSEKGERDGKSDKKKGQWG